MNGSPAVKKIRRQTTCILNNKVFCIAIMKHIITLLLAFVVLVSISSCGRTIYRGKYLMSRKYTNGKERYHFWHRHGARPRGHYGGYW